MKKTAPVTQPAPEERPARRGGAWLDGQHIIALDMGRNAHYARVALGDTIEDIKNPRYFGLAAGRIRRGDFIEFSNNDGSVWGQSVVLASDDASRMIWHHVLRCENLKALLTEGERPDFSKAVIEQQTGGNYEWRIRIDHQILRDGIPTKAAAELWLREHVSEINEAWTE
jgi:hypothetical protein